MLTYEDCLDLCGLTEDEIDAIAEHEHTDRMHAIATAGYLARAEGGDRAIRRMIIDDIRHAQRCGNATHEQELKRVLHHYMVTHPHSSEQRSS